MTKWIRFIVLALLIFSLSAQVFAQDRITIGDSIDGEADDEPIEYEISLEKGQTIEINIDATWDTYFELYDPNDTLVAFDDDGGDGTQSRLIYVAEDTAIYTLVVIPAVDPSMIMS